MSTTTTASSYFTAVKSRNWLDLPPDVTAKILLKLNSIEILERAQKVCLSWRRICKDPSMWRKIDMKFRHLDHVEYMEMMCRQAVDRSDGQVIDISIENCGSDKILKYITQRTSGLKRLRLVICGISNKGLIESAAKLPLLEELELTLCHIFKEALEAVGKSCRLLNSFKFNHDVSIYDHASCDDEALAIAENMLELRHLQLLGNRLTSNGVQAILNGCPQLESLDLRRCCHLCLESNLIKTCTDQVKSLKLPDAPMDGYLYANESAYYEYSDDAPMDAYLYANESAYYEYSDDDENDDDDDDDENDDNDDPFGFFDIDEDDDGDDIDDDDDDDDIDDDDDDNHDDIDDDDDDDDDIRFFDIDEDDENENDDIDGDDDDDIDNDDNDNHHDIDDDDNHDDIDDDDNHNDDDDDGNSGTDNEDFN